ncbi:MAG: class I SAM-dependent methyltransferase, partial [Alphaproteobacteria bacterium]
MCTRKFAPSTNRPRDVQLCQRASAQMIATVARYAVVLEIMPPLRALQDRPDMLSWEKVEAIPGWFGFHSYALWRSLLDFQKAEDVRGDLLEIGVWRGRSASVLASYRRDGETLYLCDLEVDGEALRAVFDTVGAASPRMVAISAPSSELPGRLDLRALHQAVRWMHIDGEHTGAAVYAELELAHRIVRADGLVVIDDFFSPRYPA